MTTDPIFWDSFDMYNGLGGNIGILSRWRAASFTGSCGMTTGRYGGQALVLNPVISGGLRTDVWVDVIFDPTGAMTHCTFAMAFTKNDISQPKIFACLKDFAMNPQVSMGVDAAGRWYAASGRDGTKYYTASLQVDNVNVWSFVAMEVVIGGGTSGMINMWANGQNLGGISGINTNPAGTGNGCVLELFCSSSPVSHVYDDVHITNGTYLDECRCESLRPVVDITSGWIKDSGTSNWSRVSETLVDGDTSYVATATSGARDLYGIGSLSSNPAKIYGANIVSFGYKTDATTQQFNNSIRSGGVDSHGPAFNFAGNYRRFDRPVLLNPSTGLAWDAAAINNLQIGPRLV